MAYNLVGGDSQLARLMKEYAKECGWKDVPEIYVDHNHTSGVTTFRTEPLFGGTKAVPVSDDVIRDMKAGKLDARVILAQLLGPVPDWTTGGPPNGLNGNKGGQAKVVTVGPGNNLTVPSVPDGSNVVYDPDCPPDQVYIMDGMDWGKKTVVMHPRMKAAYEGLGYGTERVEDQVNYPKLQSPVFDSLELRQRKEELERQKKEDLAALKRELARVNADVERREAERMVDVKPRGRKVRVV